VVIVFDRVESTRPELEKKFLLHTVNEPSVEGRLSVAENGGGRLSTLTLLPADAKLQLVGGAGREAWVDGKNYPPAPKWKKPVDIKRADNWRLEVSPGAPRTRDHFLHVLFVDDAGAPAIDSTKVKSESTDTAATVRVEGWELVFPFAAGEAAQIRRINNVAVSAR
jgi:heparin/heparan-sulfate lyase